MLQATSQLYNAGWLNIVFKNRNKYYGAYALRLESSSIILRAAGIAVLLFILLIFAPQLYEKIFPKATSIEIAGVVVELKPIVKTLPIAEKKQPIEAAKEVLKTVPNPSKIVVAPDRPEMRIPTLADSKDAVVGSVFQEGAPGKGNEVNTSNEGNGLGTEMIAAAEEKVLELAMVEKYPAFEGGMAAWAKFIQRNLKYPYRAVEDGIQGKVYISFVVQEDGSITNVQVIKGIGGGCDEEAVRVLKKSPKWIPGMQNKRNVRVRYQMPIVFTLN